MINETNKMNDLLNSMNLFCIIFLTLLVSCGPSSNQTQIKSKEYKSDTTDLANSSLGSPPGFYIADVLKNEYIIPFEFYDMNLMVDAKMNGMNIKMLIDNGVMWDKLWFYGSDITDSLGIQKDGYTLVIGAGEGDGVNSNNAYGLSIAFGEILFKDQDALVTSKESGFFNYFPGIAGQVCGAFFKHFVVEIDFDRRVVVLHRKETFEYVGNGIQIKMTRNAEGSYSIPMHLKMKGKESIDHDIFIDLGGIDPVALPINEKLGFDRPNTEKIYLGTGASGEIYGYNGSIEYLNIAGYEMMNVPAIFEESDNKGNYINTTIGLPLLMKFNLVFDYFNETLYLEPNMNFNEPYKNN